MMLGDQDGKLRVHYSDRLVTLLREVRQLAALGFVIPAKIQAVAKTAQHFYRQGVILKQVHIYRYRVRQRCMPFLDVPVIVTVHWH